MRKLRFRRLSDFSKVTQLIKGRAAIFTVMPKRCLIKSSIQREEKKKKKKIGRQRKAIICDVGVKECVGM